MESHSTSRFFGDGKSTIISIIKSDQTNNKGEIMRLQLKKKLSNPRLHNSLI